MATSSPDEQLAQHSHFLREAIALALHGMRAGDGGPFGAVIVRDDQIVGRGWNQVTGANGPTAHAEIVAIRDACRHLKTFQLAGCVLYASCEPCPMCLAAIYWSRLSAIYFASSSSEAAAAGFDDDFIRSELLLPAANRTLKQTQHALPDAAALFDEWRRKLDKTPY